MGEEKSTKKKHDRLSEKVNRTLSDVHPHTAATKYIKVHHRSLRW